MTLNQFKIELDRLAFDFRYKWHVGEKTDPARFPGDNTMLTWWNQFVEYGFTTLKEEYKDA